MTGKNRNKLEKDLPFEKRVMQVVLNIIIISTLLYFFLLIVIL